MAANNCPNGAVNMSSANGLVGTGFASSYQLQPCMSRFLKVQ